MKTDRRSSIMCRFLALTLLAMLLPGQTAPASQQTGMEIAKPGQAEGKITPVSQPVKAVNGQTDPAGTEAVKSGPLNAVQPAASQAGQGQKTDPPAKQGQTPTQDAKKASEPAREQANPVSPLPVSESNDGPASTAPDPASPARLARLASPATALLSPSGGLLTVEEKAQVHDQDGHAVITLLLPAKAEQLQLTVPGQTIVRWSSLTVPMISNGLMARERKRLLDEKGWINGQLAAIKLQLSLWEELPSQAGLTDLEGQLDKVRTAVPALVQERTRLTDKLNLVEKALSEMPSDSADSGRQVQIVLKDKVEARELTVQYSYHLPDCGWQPVYYFDARPSSGEGIGVRLMADVWQRTGTDWKDTEVTLVTRPASGARAPASLRPWIVESRPEPKAMVERSANRVGARAMAMQEDAMPVAAKPVPPAHAKVAVDSNAVYATWTLAVRGLPEGNSRLLMAEDTWKAPLQWLARPGERENRVWIMSKYTIPEGQVWPEGRAEYSLDGQNVGHDSFNPKGREVTLFFGADPRVTVRVESDGKKRSESGLIGKTRNLAWSWTYTINNSHAKPVTVRIERPAPQIVDEDVKVTYDNAPEPVLDNKKHVLRWDVTAPASGSAEVRHGLTISAPASMNLWPVAP